MTQARQPLHTLYVPADRLTRSTVSEFGVEALRLVEAHAPDDEAFVDAFGIHEDVAERTRERTLARLRRLPVEDLRVDFEDGYGVRSDEEEDGHAAETAHSVAGARGDENAPPWFGLRVKSFDDDALRARSVRTLERFLSTLVSSGNLPDGFVATFPKVTDPAQVASFAETLSGLESSLGLADGSLRFEVQIETPRSVLGPDGSAAAPRILEAGADRITGMHLGVFDYTSALGLMPWEQRLDHPANDFARQVLQVTLAGTGVWISDGSSNVVPANDETPVRCPNTNGSMRYAVTRSSVTNKAIVCSVSLNPGNVANANAAGISADSSDPTYGTNRRTAVMPPPTPLLAGTPTRYAHSPE